MQLWAVEIAYHKNGKFKWNEVCYVMAPTKEEAEKITKSSCYVDPIHREWVTGNTVPYVSN